MSRAAPPSSVLGRLLETAGYRLDSRHHAILAVRSVDHRAVLIVRAPRSPAEVESWFPADAVHRTIVYDDEPGAHARSMAADRGIEVLSPETLGPALGELLLPSPIGPAAPGGEGYDATPLSPPLAVLPEGERIVRPRLGRTEAEALAGIDGSRYVLRLVPFYVAPYRIRPLAPSGVPGAVLHRLVAVNAISRRAEVWEDGERELVEAIDEPHQRLAPQLGESAALAIAVDAIRRHHTIDVEHTEQHDGALVIETRRILPAADDLRIAPLALLLVPFWYAEAAEGRVVLDGVTGRRVSPSDGGGA
ncbi:MAG TPA: hypothetical protein VEL82_03520 [Thermoplasmata archaeon]|nr:hypothetical protein [Thermoplasmata archaeon]